MKFNHAQFNDDYIHRIAEQFLKLGCAQLYDAASRYCQVLPSALKPRTPNRMLAAPIFPVCTQNDMLPVLQGLDAIPSNWVLFVYNNHQYSEALAGDIVLTAMQAQGVAGLIVDGAVRDIDSLAEFGLPVFSRDVNFVSAKTAKTPAVEVPMSINYGDFQVDAGDYLFADSDGMLLVKQQYLTATILGANHLLDREQRLKESLTNGGRLGDLIGLKAYIAGEGELRFNV